MNKKKIQSLKVGIVGEPNSGKSTLLNTILKKKYTIVSRKAQTTIKNSIATLSIEGKQIIFSDTPGIAPYKKYLERSILKETTNTVLDAHIIVLVLDIKKNKIEDIEEIIKYYDNLEVDIVVALNKIDLLSNNSFLVKVEKIKKKLKSKIVFSISASKNLGVKELISYITKSKKFVNSSIIENVDLSTDKNYLKEIVREKILNNIHQEIPFNLKFITDKVKKNKDKSITVYITIILNKSSYKPIILGKKGANIKKISMQARKDLEKNLKKKYHLYIYLKTQSNKKNKFKKVSKNDNLG